MTIAKKKKKNKVKKPKIPLYLGQKILTSRVMG
jgi:hypothetical protein